MEVEGRQAGHRRELRKIPGVVDAFTEMIDGAVDSDEEIAAPTKALG